MSAPVPTYRHHKPSGKAVVTINGRDFYLGPWNSPESRQEYDRLIAEWTANGRQLSEAVSLGDLTVMELAAAYLDFAKSYYVADGKPGPEYVAMRDVLKVVLALYGRTPVKSFGPLALKAIRETMVSKKWVRKRINAQINRVRRVFKWGVENKLVPPLVLEGKPNQHSTPQPPLATPRTGWPGKQTKNERPHLHPRPDTQHRASR